MSTTVRNFLATCAALCAFGGISAPLSGADAPALPGKLPLSDPLAKVAPTILPYLLDPHMAVTSLPRSSVAARTPGTIAARLDVVVTPDTLQAISATGAVIVTSSERWNSVSIEATPAQLRALASLPAIKQILLRHRPRLSGLDQGDGVMHTNTLRSTYGLTGAGRTIGMISDSVDDTFAHPVVTGTVPTAMLSGIVPQTAASPGPYLPPSIQVVDFGPPGGTDEGEGMLEEVYSVAPGAPLAFASSGTTDDEMAANIGKLASSAGCTIIGDDVSYLDEPFFQDGPIAQAIDTFQAAGNLYFAATGNNNTSGIMMPYQEVPGTPEVPPYAQPVTGGSFHNWGQGGATPGFLPIVVPAGTTIDFVLEWNQPYSSWGLGAGSQADFDIYAYDSAATTANVLAESIATQGTAGHPSGDPNEIMEYTNPNTPANPPSHVGDITIYIAVNHYAGVTDAVLRLVLYSDGEYTPPSSTLFSGPVAFGHCTASGCLAVAAAPWNTPSTVEFFSSKGGWGSNGVPFYFSTSGAAFSSPQLRNKPDLTAPDGVHTSDFGTIVQGDTSGYPSFYGTSAATPNAAACAALVWAAQPNESNAQIVSRLESTAGTVTSPDSPQPNDYTGYGLVNGLAAAAGTSVASVTSNTASGTIYGGTVPITVTFSQAVTVGGTGTPTLTLNTTPPRSASYVSNNGSGGLLFDYQIVAGDQDSALDVLGASALTLNGATISDTQLAAVGLTLPAAGAARSLTSSKTIVIDSVAPVLTISAPMTTSATSFTTTFSFSQPVVGFGPSSVSLSNATAGTFTQINGSTYSLVVIPTAPGAVGVTVAPGVQNPYSQVANGATASTTYTLAQNNSGSTATATAGASSSGGGGGGGGCGLGGGMGLVGLLAGLGWWRRRRSP